MIEIRIVKAAMVASLAAFAGLVAFDNITDYASNSAFVQHVLSMDTTFPRNALMYRAINSPVAWNVSYWLIIAGEGLTGICFLVAAVSMLRALRADAAAFARSKRFAYIGAGVAFAVWFLGFMVVAGEWFAMWQSHQWNGQDAAFRFYMTMLAVIIFVNQPDAALS